LIKEAVGPDGDIKLKFQAPKENANVPWKSEDPTTVENWIEKYTKDLKPHVSLINS
jgi:hypothetical protein